LRDKVERGTLHVTVKHRLRGASSSYRLDEALLEQFARALERVHVKLGWTSVDQHPLDLGAIAQLPGVVAADEGAEGDLDAFWERLRPVLDEALARLVAMRREEGRGIATELKT